MTNKQITLNEYLDYQIDCISFSADINMFRNIKARKDIFYVSGFSMTNRLPPYSDCLFYYERDDKLWPQTQYLTQYRLHLDHKDRLAKIMFLSFLIEYF